MANWLKWLVGTIAACAVTVVFVQSVEIGNLMRPYDDRGAARLNGAINLEEGMLRETVWADTLLPRLPASPGLRVEVLADMDVGPDTVLRRAAEKEWGAVVEPAARVAVFAIPDTLGAYSSRANVTRNLRTVYFAGANEGGPYCAAVVPVATNAAARAPSRRFDEPVLGPCLWWAKYGPPGAGVAEWLRSAHGYHLGARADASLGRPGNVTLRRRFAQRSLTGQLSPYAVACVQGDAAHCLHAVTEGAQSHAWFDPGAGTGLAIYRSRYYWSESHFGGREQFMLAELEAEFGRERFGSFWRGDGDVTTAFASAFGTQLGAWVQQWARTRFPGIEPSDDSALTLVLSSLTLLVLFGVAIVAAQRRQVR